MPGLQNESPTPEKEEPIAPAEEVPAEIPAEPSPEMPAEAEPVAEDTPTAAKKPKKSLKRRILKGVLIALLVLLLLVALLVGFYFYLYYSGRKKLLDRPEPVIIQPPQELIDEVEDDGDLVHYNGKTYRFNDKVLGVLVMGVDKEAIANDTAAGTNGQADTLLMAAIDTVTGAVKIIPISRETMVEVDQYTKDGALVGSKVMQLCLAYAYANDGHKSCQNVCRSVSRLLYGAPVDAYIAIDMEGVERITDALGGVTLTALEDINYRRGNVFIDKGDTVTLSGHQAIGYIRYRNDDTNANNRRMQRQKQFFNAFVNTATKQLKADVTKLFSYYSTVEPYVVSDLDLDKITYLATTCLINRSQLGIDFLSLAGETVMGENYVEFHADSRSVYEAVLQAFYVEVK